MSYINLNWLVPSSFSNEHSPNEHSRKLARCEREALDDLRRRCLSLLNQLWVDPEKPSTLAKIRADVRETTGLHLPVLVSTRLHKAFVGDVTAEVFEEITGEPPKDDDLERANCTKHGEIGHDDCGFCDVRENFRFIKTP